LSRRLVRALGASSFATASRIAMRSGIARRLYELIFGDRDPVALPGTATGTPGNGWTVFANVPDCFDDTVQGFQSHRSARRKIAPQALS
jgi:hypothetical protein